MKVLLQQDVKGTGRAGEIVEVSNGYARNYLFPQKLAVPADAASVNAANIQKSAAQHRKQQAAQRGAAFLKRSFHRCRRPSYKLIWLSGSFAHRISRLPLRVRSASINSFSRDASLSLIS